MHSNVINFVLLVTISNSCCSEPEKLQECDNTNSVDISSGTHLQNGDINFRGVTYAKHEYYVNNETGEERGCICSKKTCIRKCCPLGYGYNLRKKTCYETTEPFDPPIWDDYSIQQQEGVNASKLFYFLIGKIECTPPTIRLHLGKATKKYHLRMDGNLYMQFLQNVPPFMIRGPDEYCVDTFLVKEPGADTDTTSFDALVCFPQKLHQELYELKSSCMLISCVFILATVAVYCWLPELRNLHGRVLIAYLLCLFVAFLVLAALTILLMIKNISQIACVTMTIFSYFWLLSALFWLNVMCFDIWWTFSGKGGYSLQKLSIRARFCAYCVYAFGIPTALTILLTALEFSGLPPHRFLPRLRQQGCFIHGTTKLIYLYGPIVVLCVANLVFFVLTTFKITQIQRQTSVLKSKDSSKHDKHRNDKQRLLLYMKLFAVMGINWILEVVSVIYPEAQVVWRFTDAYNVLVGLTIFIIFVCKRKIFRLIKKKFEKKDHRPRNDTGNIRDNNNIRMKRWHDNRHQRESRDTIVTTIDTDTASVVESEF